MQVRTGHSPRRADVAQNFAALQVLTHVDADLRKVAVHRQQASAVIHDDIVAVEEVVAHIDHAAGEWRLDGRARRCGDVHAGVRIARLAVEHAAQSERTRTPARYRLIETQSRRCGRRERIERGAHLGGFGRHARFVLG
jgi:hypothetical protein